MKKFGRVFLKKTINNNSSELELIQSVYFSNLDHKWYDKNGKLHPQFEKYKGNSFLLRFITNQHDKTEVPVQFEGNFQLPYKLGEIVHQDFDGVEAAEKEDFELLQRFNLITQGLTAEKCKRGIAQATFLAAMYPGSNLSELKMFRIFNLAFFAFDDVMEKLSVSLKYEQLDFFRQASFDILDGKPVDLNTIVPNVPGLPDVVPKYLKLIQFFCDELSSAENVCNGLYVREAFKEHIQGVCIESCSEWKEQTKACHYGGQKKLRAIVAGAFICFELGLFDKKIQVKDEIRNTFLFKWIVKLYAQHVTYVNDIVSFRKEIEAGHSGSTCNKVYLLHYIKDLPLEVAIQKVLEKANKAATLIGEAGQLLCKLYENDENVKQFVKNSKDMIYGHTQWCTLTERYHKNFVFDCVLEEAL